MEACRKTAAPSSSVWSLSTLPSRRPPSSLARHFLRSVERVEDGDAVRTADDRLAIQRERPGPQQRRGDGDRRIAVAPVVPPPGEQPHDVTLAPNLQPVAVVLDLVHQPGPVGALGARVGMQGGT
jgi:hypothetical protein